MTTITTSSLGREASILPARPVEPRERSFPVLSIAYRIFAQNEIWCIDDGNEAVDAYCRMFEWQEEPPAPIEGNLQWVLYMFRRGNSGFTANQDTIKDLTDNIFRECRSGGHERIVPPDLKRRFPFLTKLYDHFVLRGKDEAEEESVNYLKDEVFRDLYCARLIW